MKMIADFKNWNMRLKTGVIALVLSLIFAFIFPLFHSEDPTAWGTYFRNLPPCRTHWFGTTGIGQDIFWLLAFSTRNSFIIGFLVAAFSTVIGVIVGMIAGFKGGTVDRIIQLVMDTFIVIPALPILILMGSLMRGRASVFAISAVLIVFNWPWPARQVRSLSISLRERDFIDTARFSGQNVYLIATKEILPFVMDWSFANFVNCVLVAIAAESGLAIIGMSNNAQATLGTMIFWANQHMAMLAGRWWWIGSPIVAIIVVFLALFLTLSGYQKYNTYIRGK